MIKGLFKHFIWIAVSFSAITTKAQDHIYSQFFSSPLYLNPALTGQFRGDIRFNMIYRNQWSSVPGSLQYISGSLDYQIPSFGGGIGVIFNRSNEGTAYLQKNHVGLLYSYSVGGENFTASFGLVAGMTNSRVDFSKLVFSDQLDPGTGYSGTPSEASKFNRGINFFDAGAGANFVLKDFMLGASLMHLNTPDESLTGSTVRLPIRTIAHASYRFAFNRFNPDDEYGSYLIPSVVYYDQAKVKSYSAGMQYKYRNINLGLWYRSNTTGGDAFVLSFIFDIINSNRKVNKLRIGLSHDATVSKINYSNTGGTSEVSVGYEHTFPNSGSDFSPYSGKKCYDFY